MPSAAPGHVEQGAAREVLNHPQHPRTQDFLHRDIAPDNIIVRKDGTPIWCSISGRAVQPGDPAQGSVWLFDDITQEHESEERVQRALAEQELSLGWGAWAAQLGIAIAIGAILAVTRSRGPLERLVGAAATRAAGERERPATTPSECRIRP